MRYLALSLITYSDAHYHLGKFTIPEYVHDPRFHVLGLAVRDVDGVVTFTTEVMDGLARLKERYGQQLQGVTVLIHQGHLTLYILSKCYGITPPATVDTLQLAHALLGRKGEAGGGGSVAHVAGLLGLGHLSDLSGLSGVRFPDGFQAMHLSRHASDTVRLIAQMGDLLLPQLSQAGTELRIAAHTLRLHHERGLMVDLQGIDRLRRDVVEDAEAWFQRAGITAEEAGSRGDFNEYLARALARTGRSLPMKHGKKGLVPATGKADEAMQTLLEDDDLVVASLAQARLARGSEVQQVARLNKLKAITLATGGTLPVHLVYHGAGTGRFAGGGGFNLQNLPKEGLGGRIRELIKPPPGHVFVLVDLAQIECRITAWLAGEQGLLSAFRDGVDIYSQEASGIFGRDVRKPDTSRDTAEEASLMAGMRQTGKQEVLGLAFGMGALRFSTLLRADPKTSPLFGRGLLSPLVCRQIVDRFRGNFPGIPRLWRESAHAFAAVACQAESHRLGTLSVGRAGDRLDLQLPSGRILRYPRIRMAKQSKTVHYLDETGEEETRMLSGEAITYGDDINLFGGKIVENMAQAIARDILVEAVLRIEQRGVPVVLHIHDEVVATCPAVDAEQVLALVTEELKRAVPWAPGLPLGAEGRISGSLAK